MAVGWRCHIGGKGMVVPHLWQEGISTTMAADRQRCHLDGSGMEVPCRWQEGEGGTSTAGGGDAMLAARDGGATSVAGGQRCHNGGRWTEVPQPT